MPAHRSPLDRDRVVKTAIDLLDQVGLDGLSLRRLATELGVQAPALYWHFANKQALLDHMVEEIMRQEVGNQPPQPGEEWDHWLAARCRDMRRMLNRHRDGAMLAASTRPVDGQWGFVEQTLAVLVGAGFTAPDALMALFTIANYVSGFTLEEQADRARGYPGDQSDDPRWQEGMAMLAPYPLLLDAMKELGDPQSDRSFESGLQLILDGLRYRVETARRLTLGPPPGSGARTPRSARKPPAAAG